MAAGRVDELLSSNPHFDMSLLIAHLWYLLGKGAVQQSAEEDPFEFIVDANDPQTRYKVVGVSRWLSGAHLGKVIS